MAGRDLDHLLQTAAKTMSRPDSSTYSSLLLAEASEIATQTGLSLRQVESRALQAGILPERYSRNQKSLSCGDQLRLLQSRVAVIGLGGLGGTVVEILARIGVGHLTLIDGDVFDESNLNRQLLSSPARLGTKKAMAAESRVQELNPAVEIRTIDQFFTADNGPTILAGAQVAVDCLDNIPARFVLQQTCLSAGIPMVSAAIAGASGQATTVFPGDVGLQQIYGAPNMTRQKGIEAILGTLPFAAVYMAAVECAEITAILLGRPSHLRHRLFLADVGEHTTELLELPVQSEANHLPE